MTALKDFFGTGEPTKGNLRWFYFADDQEPLQEEGQFTFYDARAKSFSRTGRSEWRFYYYGDFLDRANAGDSLFLARSTDGSLFALVVQQDSAWLRAATALFDIHDSTPAFDAIDLERQELEFLQRSILLELGFETQIPVSKSDEQLVLETFGRSFPTTKRMSDFARSQVEVDLSKIDETLIRWLNREEELFKALEKAIIKERLAKGFEDVEAFISFSLSVHQRRKSRMGHALQNHLSEVFMMEKLRFTPQAKTEGKSRPDFVFPGEEHYSDAAFPDDLLAMLGAKATCKDRWRQVLVEANRIPKKHLCTLEAGISVEQTAQMSTHGLTLVVPSPLHSTYTPTQLKGMLGLADFVQHVRANQRC